MSEMLGNQYFMARNYVRASTELEKALLSSPTSKPVRCKLIICYAQTGNLEKSFDLFISLCHEDVDFIIGMDSIEDDCPCPDILPELEKDFKQNKNSFDFLITLGILSLYCEFSKSINYFSMAHKLDKNNSKVKYILSLLKLRLAKDELVNN
jgi:hypothetical protein